MALLDQAAAAAVPRAKKAKVAAEEEDANDEEPCRSPAKVSRLTVWCKSLVFHGEGYAVFDDADGRMVFRVDNYASRRSMALMDHAGRVLLTVRRRHCKVLSLLETWEVYKGDVDDDGATCSLDATNGQDEAPRLVMRATKDLGNPSCTVSMLAAVAATPTGGDEPAAACGHGLIYRMSWSRREEWSRVHHSGSINSLVAEVRRKRGGPRKTTLLGKDVLSLTVQPGMDQAVAMAMLMISNSYR
ncbi:hypothetical protein E2562_025327 [Oryza meyeriana var. granulata]|uniref:Tubby C-terminal domain-containing protein n=1 Tax=Oryza meyeriana var. granulata TaxID=110450 RepID=A0A6G1EPE6_9ORYZ|nr:hypothetical protein E2562_025327 [Oryza meyeriana var. granulata]